MTIIINLPNPTILNFAWILIASMWALPLTSSHLLNSQSILALAALTVLMAVHALFTKDTKLPKWRPDEVLALLFLAFYDLATIAILSAGTITDGFSELALTHISVLLYLLFRNKAVKHPEKHLFVATIILVTIFSLFGFYEIITGPNIRLSGMFFGDENYTTYPNAMADMLILTLPILFYFIQKYKFDEHRYKNVLSLFLFLINLTAFWLTQSRGAIIALAILVGTYFAFELVIERNPKRFLVGAAFVGLSLVATISFAAIINNADPYHLEISERIASQDPSSEQSLSERYVLWDTSKKMIFSTPARFLVGQGPGEFGQVFSYYTDTPLSYQPDHPHNIVLKIATETGVITALLFVLWLITSAFIALHNFAQTSAAGRKVWAPIFVGLTGVLAHQLVDYNLNFSLLTLLTFSFAGIIANPLNWQSTKIQTRKYTSKKTAWILIACLLILVSSVKIYWYMNPDPNEVRLATANCVQDANSTLDAELAYLCFTRDWSEQHAPPEPEKFTEFLNEHQNLLEVNAHQYVTSENPKYIFKTYQYILSKNPTGEFAEKFEKYKETYTLEAKKFNDRYGTSLPLDWNE